MLYVINGTLTAKDSRDWSERREEKEADNVADEISLVYCNGRLCNPLLERPRLHLDGKVKSAYFTSGAVGSRQPFLKAFLVEETARSSAVARRNERLRAASIMTDAAKDCGQCGRCTGGILGPFFSALFLIDSKIKGTNLADAEVGFGEPLFEAGLVDHST